MARLDFHPRAFFAGCLSLLVAVPSLCEGSWESTVSPFPPGPFSELRPTRVHYNFGWNGLTAATAELHLTRTANGRFRLESTGGTIGLTRALWKLDAKNTSVSDAQTLRPIQSREIESRRSKTLETEVNYTPDGVTSRREERRGPSLKTKTQSFEFPNVLSLNSAMLYLRARPLPDGAVERIVVYPATSAYLCTITVLGRERITGPTGTADAIKLDFQLSKIGKQRELLPHKKFKRATAWVSDDADRLILRIEAQIFIGTVYAELQSVKFENGKR